VEAFYASTCAPCHGLEREGSVGPALTPERLTRSDSYYIETILEGRPNTAMAAWGESGLSEEDARTLVEFLRGRE
jgi:mono/diheme cytochrome c family protein